MRVVCDVEANSLENPTKIWVIVCKDIDTGIRNVFRRVSDDEEEKKRFLSFASRVKLWIGHNWLEYDLPVLVKLLDFDVGRADIADTWVIGRLVDYSKPGGHSLEAYGDQFGLPKGVPIDEKGAIPPNYFPKGFFDYYSQDMEDYCVRDVDICEMVFRSYEHIYASPDWQPALALEHQFASIVCLLHDNGFSFNVKRATTLLRDVSEQLAGLDEQILKEFPAKEVLIREFTPKATKFGTISKSSVPRLLHSRIHDYEVGKTYRHTKLVPFNPSSHKQLIEVLTDAGWVPTDKTQTHIDTEREINRLKYTHKEDRELDLAALYAKMVQLKKFGWKINENNLSTLPDSAPSPARLLAKRILLESRRRTLTEWLGLVRDDGRIHGKFYGIGAWTHRMAHQSPNTANIPNEFRTDGSRQLLGKEMRSLWQAPRNRLLVGVDAEGIQLRIFAHYIDDSEFTEALVKGKKDDKTDPHSLNQKILGGVCKSRQSAKRFIYALVLGAGLGKLAEILGCSKEEAKDALDRLLRRYGGLEYLRKSIIPADAKRGWFKGLDGRKVILPGATAGERGHLCMSGYLQNGEAICMKKACILWHQQLHKEFGNGMVALEHYPNLIGNNVQSMAQFQHSPLSYRPSAKIKLVNFVHDEWQTEVPNDMAIAKRVAEIQADSLRIVGEELKLKCPLAGSYWNDDHKDFTIATNWSMTH